MRGGERSVLWFRWDHLSSGEVRAATYPVLSGVKSGWESPAASGQTGGVDRHADRQTDRQAVGPDEISLRAASVTTTYTTRY